MNFIQLYKSYLLGFYGRDNAESARLEFPNDALRNDNGGYRLTVIQKQISTEITYSIYDPIYSQKIPDGKLRMSLPGGRLEDAEGGAKKRGQKVTGLSTLPVDRGVPGLFRGDGCAAATIGQRRGSLE